jgi:uncharacterized membrane protein
MSNAPRERRSRGDAIAHASFEISIALKAIDGALEVLAAILLARAEPQTLAGWLHVLTDLHLPTRLHDAVAHAVARTTEHIADSRSFAIVYLLTHGLAKLVVIGAVVRGRSWSYPLLIAMLAAFIVYQMVRWTEERGAAMLALSVFDAVLIVLTWREWRARA